MREEGAGGGLDKMSAAASVRVVGDKERGILLLATV
jgi:hypothetical protein